MSNFDDSLLELKKELFEEQCVKEYFYYKNKIKEDEEIKSLDASMRMHQKNMCKNKENSSVYFKEKEAYEDAKNKLENNPLLINYQIAKDEVFSLLVDIKELLS